MKNKKSLIALVGIVALLAIGGTVAYYTSFVTLDNQFNVASYKIETIESFVSPNNWQPCDATPKTVAVTNKSSVDVSVRIKLSDYWKDKNGNDLPDLVENGQKLTSINFHDGYENYWVLKAGWYTYKTNLAPNTTTEPLIDSVSLSCNANLTGAVSYSDGGKTAVTGDSPYADAKFHVNATIQTIQADAAEKWTPTVAHIIENEMNQPTNFRINFAKEAKESDDVEIANGNGVGEYTENGQKIYYYRGELDNNNVIWGNYCWVMIRTTYTGGTKVIYNGVPTTVDGKKQCLATGVGRTINQTVYRFNDSSMSPAHIGYMYGAVINSQTMSPGSRSFVFSNNISKEGNTYTLNTDEGESVTGTWGNKRLEAAVRYHYFCTNGAATCSNTQIAYILSYSYEGTIYYLPLNGYEDIEDAKDAMFRNDNDSIAKKTVETWFANSGLSALEDDLEDAVYCNERVFQSGPLAGEDSNASPDSGLYSDQSYSTADWRNAINALTNGYSVPALECPSIRDSFTKSTANGNGKLKYKVGLITSDEIALAGIPVTIYSTGTANNYLYTNVNAWSMSPMVYGWNYAGMVTMRDGTWRTHGTYEQDYLRPVVTLKPGTEYSSGSGSRLDPFIVE